MTHIFNENVQSTYPLHYIPNTPIVKLVTCNSKILGLKTPISDVVHGPLFRIDKNTVKPPGLELHTTGKSCMVSEDLRH